MKVYYVRQVLKQVINTQATRPHYILEVRNRVYCKDI